MSDLDALKNRGAVRLGAPPPPGEKTIVVLGVARGGTSMVAGALHKLGVFMGDQAHAPVFEDLRLATPLEAGDERATRAVLDAYDQAHPVWGFKRPGLLERLDSAHRLFRNPVYVVVFRDVLAIGNRNALSMRADPLKSMRNAIKQYQRLLDFLDSHTPSALLLSNEKTLIHPGPFVAELCDWLGLESPAQRIAAATASIVVDHPQYLDTSRLKFLGSLDRATTRYVSGWAFIRGRTDHATLKVSVNGRLLGTVTADRHRGDVHKKRIHPTGFCGFRFEFDEQHGVNAGDEVTIRFTFADELLRGSPRTISGTDTD